MQYELFQVLRVYTFLMIQKCVKGSFLFLLAIGAILPSDGNHGALAPKSLAFLTAASFFLIYFISRWQLNLSQAKNTLFVWLSITFFALWYLVGIDQNPQIPSGQFDQFKVFMTTLFVPFSALYLIHEGVITPQKILRIVIFANFSYCLLKVTLMALHLLGVINVWTLMHLTGLRFMSMNILGELGRIQTSVDLATPFLAYFVLQSKSLNLGFSPKFKGVFLLITALSTFLSFSRLLIFAYGASIFFYGLTLSWQKQVKFWIGMSILSLTGIILAGPQKVQQVVEKRLFSQDNDRSDATRREQIDAMMAASEKAPFWGKGLGGYTEECVRDFTLPHAYEVQWVAFFMQFGLIGIFFLLTPIAYIISRLLELPLRRNQIGYLLLFILFLIAGFTNPFLISLTSGILYTLFLLPSLVPYSRFNKMASA